MGGFDWKANWKWVALGVGIFIAVIVIVVVAVVLTSAGPSGSSAKVEAEDNAKEGNIGGKDYQTAFLECNNARRKEKGLDPLVLDDKLNGLAEECAQYYIDVGKSKGFCPFKGDAGEVHCFFPKELELDKVGIAQEACDKWSSTQHHMLSKKCKRVGFATAKSADGTDWVVAKYSTRAK